MQSPSEGTADGYPSSTSKPIGATKKKWDEVIVTDPRGIFSEYDGIVGFGYGSGLLIKLNASRDAVQVFYFYAHSQLDD